MRHDYQHQAVGFFGKPVYTSFFLCLISFVSAMSYLIGRQGGHISQECNHFRTSISSSISYPGASSSLYSIRQVYKRRSCTKYQQKWHENTVEV